MIAEAVEVVEMAAEVGLAGRHDVFTARELAYAAAKTDPERRLAARLAAKRALVRLLGGDVAPEEVEIVRGRGGPPRVALAPRAAARLEALGARDVLVSLTHGETHAGAVVVLRGET